MYHPRTGTHRRASSSIDAGLARDEGRGEEHIVSGNVAILGTGMAAYGAARVLRAAGIAYQCYDRNPYPGGHTASFRTPSGFTFDDGPHV